MFSMERFVRNERAPDVRMFAPGGRVGTEFVPSLMRPYFENGRVWVDVLVGNEQIKDAYGMPVINERTGMPLFRDVYEPELVQDRRRRDLPVINITSNATVLRKDQWIMLDQRVLGVARKRLKAWTDLRNANTFGGFDGMSTPILEFERMTEAGEAVVSMSPKTRGNNFAPTFELDGLPLPITHCDFDIDARFLAISRARGGPSAETTRGEYAGRRVAEAIEMTTIGVLAGIQYGDATDWVSSTSKVYGYTNHPDRITKTNLTASSGITGEQFLTNVLAMIELAEAQNFFGPYMLYVSAAYDQKARDDFKANSDKSTRQRVLEIDQLQGMSRLDYLSGDVMILVQMGENIDAINGMEIVTVQRATTDWEELSFKVMGIQVPRIRSVRVNTGTTGPATNSAAKAPIVHGTTS